MAYYKIQEAATRRQSIRAVSEDTDVLIILDHHLYSETNGLPTDVSHYHQVKEVSLEYKSGLAKEVDLKGHTSTSQPQQGQQQQLQKDKQLAANDPLLLEAHHELHRDLQNMPKDYIQEHDPNYYMNPQSFLRQKPPMGPLDEDSIRLGHHPLQTSPTLRSTRPSTYPHDFASNHALSSYFQGLSSTPSSPSFPANANRNSMHNPYPYDMSSIHATLSYQRRLSMFLPSYTQDPCANATLPRSYPRELPSSSSYGQGFPAPSYAQHRLSLNRNDPLLMERVPSSSSLVLRGSSSAVAVDADGESPRTSVVNPRPLTEDLSSASSQRESSV
ncbi:uncharacterized protein [Palaemon carinicauda]|uniref:uncharacterized protein n=1 Tax=Palaemon carinicauda TaxID=392227 RepID=UPI0035B6A258